MRSAIDNNARAPCSREMPASVELPPQRTTSTAIHGRRVNRSFRFLFLPGLQLSECLFQFMNVFRSELPGVGKLRHHGRGSAAKETQYLVEHAISCHIPADERLEDISVPNLFNPAQYVLRLHPIDDRLDCGIRGPWFGE